MRNLYLVRTATIASLVAAMIGLGWMGMHDDGMQVPPEIVAVSGAASAPALHFPAGFELSPNPNEPEAFEYY